MLGDTSMGMINGYFGPKLLARHGFSEHKIDQAWILDRGRRLAPSRIDDAFAFVRDRGVTFHWREQGAEDFDENATKEQLRDYLAVLDLVREFKADCVGWAIPARAHPVATRLPTSRRDCSTACAVPSRTGTRLFARPKPTRATRCRWS
jgi:hypothetical protein